MRKRKTTKDRSTGFNCSMPLLWIEAIEMDCERKGIDRSTWIRAAAVKMLPVLDHPDRLEQWLADNG